MGERFEIRNFFQKTDALAEALRHGADDVYIYGLSLTSRMLFHWLWCQGHLPAGIVVDSQEQEFLGCQFMSRKIISVADYKEKRRGFLLAPFPQDVQTAAKLEVEARPAYLKPSGNFFAYGAGRLGLQFAVMAKEMGIKLVGFADIDEFKQGTYMNGYSVISPSKLADEVLAHGAELVVTLDKEVAFSVARNLGESLDLSQVWVYQYEDSPSAEYGLILPGELPSKLDVFDSGILLYLRYLHESGKQLILWGGRVQAEYVRTRLAEINIPVAYLVSKSPKGDWARDCWELAYEDPHRTLVMVLRPFLEEVQLFCKESGLPEEMFCWTLNHGQPYPLCRRECFDPGFGLSPHCRGEASVLHKSSPLVMQRKERTWRIGVLGGSTSMLYLSPESTWPELLTEVAAEHGVRLEIFDGALAGQIVGQELVRFARDMVNKDLDMVISFSGINEPTALQRSGGYFLSQWQSSIYEFASDESKRDPFRSVENRVYYGQGPDTCEENWLACERLMHGMCQEYGIEFRSFLQPYIAKKTLTNFEKEAILSWLPFDVGYSERSKSIGELRQHALKYAKECPWIIDGTGIFDGIEETVFLDFCHVNTLGNRIIAEAIYGIVADALELPQ